MNKTTFRCYTVTDIGWQHPPARFTLTAGRYGNRLIHGRVPAHRPEVAADHSKIGNTRLDPPRLAQRHQSVTDDKE